MELEANIFRYFISLWYLPLVKISKKSMREILHALNDLTWNYPVKHLFLLATVALITVKMSFTHFHSSSFRETYSSIKTMQSISPNYNSVNGVKQIKTTEWNLSQSCTLCQLLKTKTLAPGSKCIKQFFLIFYHYLTYICWVDVIHLTCHVLLKCPW